MAWKSNGDQRVWWATYLRGIWSTAVAIPHLITEDAPALGFNSDRLLIVVRNPNNELLVECELLEAGQWTLPRAVTTVDFEFKSGGLASVGSPAHTTTTSHAPAAARLANGALMLAFRRENGRLATLRKGGSGGGAVAAWSQFSDRAPTLIASGKNLIMMSVGPEQRLSYAIREPGMEVELRPGVTVGKIPVVEALRDV